LSKIYIFNDNFDFWRTFIFLTKIWIFDDNFNFWRTFHFLAKIWILTKILIQRSWFEKSVVKFCTEVWTVLKNGVVNLGVPNLNEYFFIKKHKNLVATFGFFTISWIFGEYLDFWPTIEFLTKIFIFDEHFNFWRKFGLLTKIWIFDQIWIFYENLCLWRQFGFLTKICVFDENLCFWRTFGFLTKISSFAKSFRGQILYRSLPLLKNGVPDSGVPNLNEYFY